MIMEKKLTVHEPARDIPVRAQVDVLVVGGGPSGLMAAQAASGKGLKVMLIESRSFLGSNMVTGLPILGFLGRKGNVVIKGLPLKFVERLQKEGQATGHRRCPLHVSLTMVGTEAVKKLSMDILEENGVETLMYVYCVGTIVEGDTVKGVIIESKAGREAILAKTVIDCTGDGDVAARAGAQVEIGDEKGRTQPPTLMFCMKGVDIGRLREEVVNHPDVYDIDIIPNDFFKEDLNFTLVGMRNQIAQARKDGLDIYVERTIIMTGIAKDEMWVNMSRVSGSNGLDPEDQTSGEFISAKQNETVVKYLNRYVPGFEHAWMEKSAPYMGYRETRRIVGEYMMTADDILNCRRFDDVIGVSAYPLDIHHVEGGDCSLYWCEDSYDIPYRVLVPKGLKNILVAGRCASMTHEAMASTRVMGPCMVMGEAAGKAASIAVQHGVTPGDIDVRQLQKELLEEGAYLGDRKL